MVIDIEALRSYLIDLYGTAAPAFPAAIVDVEEVEEAGPEELLRIAEGACVDVAMFRR